MSDPWSSAADDYTERYRANEQRRLAEQSGSPQTPARQRANSQLEKEIADGAAALEAVLRSRGAAARQLLAAVNRGFRAPGRFVRFGTHRQGGGNAVAVIFNHNGLQRVSEHGGDYTQNKNARFTPSTASEAVSFAVRYGGKRAGDVAAWFVQELDRIAAEARR